MVIAIYCLLLILSLLFQKSKGLMYAILVFMWILGTFCYGTADDSVYLSRYNSPQLWNAHTEYGFAFIIQICRLLNLPFIGFKGVVFLIETTLVGSTVIKYSRHPKLVLLLFIVCPYPLLVVQIRSSLAASIMVFSCRYLLDNEKRKEWIANAKFILGIILAALVHTSAIMWLLLFVIKKLDTKKTIIFAIVTNVIIYFILKPNRIASLISIFGAGNRIRQYLSSAYATSEWRHVGPAIYVIYVSAFMLLFLFKYKSKCHIRNITRIDTEANQLEFIKKANIIFLVLVSIILRYTSEVTRIQEGFMVINYIYLTNCISTDRFSLKRISNKNLSKLSTIVLFVGIYAGLILLHYLMDLVWIPFWFNNSLLSF